MGDIFGDIGKLYPRTIPNSWLGHISLVRPKKNSGHLMHGGLVDDEGLDYDELRHGPTGRSDCSPFDSKRWFFFK